MYFTLITSMEITWHGLWSENHTLLSMNYVITEITRTKPGMITSHTSVFAVYTYTLANCSIHFHSPKVMDYHKLCKKPITIAMIILNVQRFCFSD